MSALFDVATVPERWHLSYTGYYAGVQLCGSETGRNSHAMLVSDERLEDADLCPSCLQVWQEA